MSVPDVVINYWIVALATVVSFFIGMLWYSPFLFGKMWMKEMGIKKHKENGMGKFIVINLIGTFITACVLAHFVKYVTAQNFADAFQLGLWIWLGFFGAATLLGSVTWEGKSWTLYFINGFYWLVNLVAMSWI